MKKNQATSLLLSFILSLSLIPQVVSADQIRIAVASNFIKPMKSLARQFKQQTQHEPVIINGSTGKLYAQIINGAPFDLFFSADKKRPQKLSQQNLIQAGSLFTYASGRLVLWSPDPSLIDQKSQIPAEDTFYRFAIANPKLAPYGRAAKQVLEKLNLWSVLQKKIVRGENIGQAFQYVKTGNAQLGLVAWSQVKNLKTGSSWFIPQDFYDPIEQQAVLLTDKAAAKDFLDFVKSESSQQFISEFGYGSP